jgi:hypothetical protein
MSLCCGVIIPDIESANLAPIWLGGGEDLSSDVELLFVIVLLRLVDDLGEVLFTVIVELVVVGLGRRFSFSREEELDAIDEE